MATVAKDFKVKNGLIVEGSTGTINGSNILTEASTEFLQDTIGSMVDGSTQTNITVTYDDSTGKLNFVAENGVADSNTDQLSEGSTNKYFTDERAQDAVGNAVGTGLSYNDGTGAIGIDSTVTTNSGSQTLTNKTISGTSNTISDIGNNSLVNDSVTINGYEITLGSSATYSTDNINEGTTNKYFTDERAQDAIGTAIANGTQTNITVTYDDATNSLSFNASGGVGSLSGTANEVEVTNAGTAYTIGLPDDVTVSNNLTVSNDLTVSGDLTVNGTTTTINSTTVSVDDKNIELASTASPDDASADGAGITVKGTTDKTWNWVDATDSWTSSEHINIASGKEYKVNGTSLKDVTETLTNKTIDGGSNTLSNIGNGSLSNSAITINGTSVSLGGTRTLGTDDVAEGATNQYFTNARAKTAAAELLTGATLSNITITGNGSGLTITAENGVADSNTDQLSEGSTNLYFTNERAEDAVGGMVTGNTETGISVTYDDNTGKLNFSVDDQFPSKSTTNLAEGTNLYFTNARAVTALESVVPNFTEIDINSVATQVAATTSVATASQVTAYQFAKADYRSAKFLVKAETASHTEISEVLVTLDASDNIAITEYAIVGTNGNLVDVTADISGSNVRLRVTTVNNSTDVTVVGTLIA